MEDDPSVRELARTTLERGGFRVFEAPDAQNAVQIWNEADSKITTLITDMILPGGLSGGKLAQRLRERDLQLVVIYISGYGTETLGTNSLWIVNRA